MITVLLPTGRQWVRRPLSCPLAHQAESMEAPQVLPNAELLRVCHRSCHPGWLAVPLPLLSRVLRCSADSLLFP